MDAAQKMDSSGASCSPEVQETVSRSRAKLVKADAYVHKALQRRREGNLISARANLEMALQIYPKYYWVQTLIKNIDRSITAELDSLRNETRYLESKGDPEGALSRIQDAMKLSPGNKQLESEAARLSQHAKKVKAEKNVQSLLDAARTKLEEGSYEEAYRLLTEGDSPKRLGPRGKELLAEVQKRRIAQINERFAVAVEMENKGDLDTAAGHTLYILELSAPGDQTSDQIVEFARLLGMKLYSGGMLSRAKELWTKALVIDPGNQKLQNYLSEVETRLNNLDRIKKGGAEGVEN